MSVVLSIRIPKKLKEEMDELKDLVDWPKEIREFLEKRVQRYRRMKVLREIDKELEKLPPTPRGLAARLVREDRERN